MVGSTRIVIIGAGVVGLATGLEILHRDPDVDVTVLEKEDDVARHQTSHNSGVIHSGIYYKSGSLQARLRRSGAEEMVRFCQEHKIPLRDGFRLGATPRMTHIYNESSPAATASPAIARALDNRISGALALA